MGPIAEILYYIAEDFCGLSYVDKFNMGLELGILDPEDAYISLSEEELETRIFVQMWRTNKFKQFTLLLEKVVSA